jgi:hypothetical protein
MEDNKYITLLNNLFNKAMTCKGFNTICTILRVGGMSDANWDPFEESRDALEDFNWFLEIAEEKRTKRCKIRVALLMYCQLIEMTAPHEILLNLLNCIHGDSYSLNPFGHLGRSKKNVPFSYVPPSAKAKFKYICDKAQECNEPDLIRAINTFFSDEVRNAFSHSDYVITDDYFRYTSGGLSQEIALAELSQIINECFSFYSAFIQLHRHWLLDLSKVKKYHRWPQYEVLELLSDENGLYGFSVHFSNGNKATYSRRKTGIEAINIMFEEDGLNYMVGFLDKLEPIWKINDIPIKNWDELA